MEVAFIELDEDANSYTCRCCLLSSEDQMDNIFDCMFEDIDFQELLTVVTAVLIFQDDGKSTKDLLLNFY